jgi:phosphatidylglycerophosphatase C
VSKRLILFDFDGTISRRDTMWEFIRFYHGNINFVIGMVVLMPVLALLAVKLIANWRAKEIVLSYFFKGENCHSFNAKADLFSKQIIPKIVRKKALQEIQKYQKEGNTLVVVTASALNWIEPWCITNGLICLATRLEIIDDLITGKISGYNCYGSEKVKRIKEQFNLNLYSEIIAFGDSVGDLEMMKLASVSYYKPFRK